MINAPMDVFSVIIPILIVASLIGIALMIFQKTSQKRTIYGSVLFFILVSAWGVFKYNDIKKGLFVAFENNKELLCGSSTKILVSKHAGYILKNEMFIKDENIIDTHKCEIFE